MKSSMPVVLLLSAVLSLAACSARRTAPKLEPSSCGTVQRVHTFDGVYLASQPAAEDFRQAKTDGIHTVLNLRLPGELKEFDEPALVRELGMEYIAIPFQSPESLTPQVIDNVRALLNDPARRPLLVHCHSANRVGAVWLAHRVLDGGLDWDAALAEAKLVGLKSPALEAAVRQYIASQESKQP